MPWALTGSPPIGVLEAMRTDSLVSWLGSMLLIAACAAPPAASPERLDTPYVVVLGTAQDGGLPQIGCRRDCCRRARSIPGAERLVTSLLLCDPASGKRWLFDASPDLAEQIERARGHPPTQTPEPSPGTSPGARPALFDGIFLTHAHMGHYAGLLQLGREAYGARDVALHATPSMIEFLTTEAPWSLLVEDRALRAEPLRAGDTLRLRPELSVTALAVPHRREFSDTVAFVIRGPRRSLLYLPDIDKWERWDRPIEEVLAEVDVALVDGTFFDEGELPGRDMSEIPHPLIRRSLERFAPLPLQERAKIHFTHLNHSNPACDPDSPASSAIRAAGSFVARDGLVITL